MRKALIILFLLTSLVGNATIYYVATNGSNNNPGTITLPFATWHYGFNKLKSGDILYIRGGTYRGVLGSNGANAFGVKVDGISGTSSSHITVSAYNGEVPILDGSSCTLTTGSNVGIIMTNCSYWDFTGLVVTNFLQYSVNEFSSPGWVEGNCSYITHNQCAVHECGNGFILWGSKDYIYYKNCDSYQNYDLMNDSGGEGGLANGFECPIDKGENIFYEGCRAFQNSDDGWDCFNGNGGSGYISYINCWSFNNGAYGGVAGDGSGFKMGVSVSSADGGVQRILKNCVSYGNSLWGYDQNDGGYGTLIQMSLYNCTSSGNKSGAFNFRNGSGSSIKNCVTLNESLGSVGSNAADHNSWQNGLSATSADFASTDASQLTLARKSDGSLPDITFMHLASGSKFIDTGADVGITYSGKGPDIGAFEVQSGTVVVPPPVPVFVSAAVENVTPTLLEMTYNLALANIVPAASAFTVLVNSSARTVNSVAISGTKIQLTLASPVVYGNTITVSYTKPTTSPLQTAAGGQAISVSNQNATNRVNSLANPVYQSSSVENTTPTSLDITFDLTLNSSSVPSLGSFSIMVNYLARNVTSVIISGNKVKLTLESAVKFGDIITFSYTKPSSNQLQSASGAQSASIVITAVTNNVKEVAKTNDPPVIVLKYPKTVYEGFINVIDATASYAPSKDPLVSEWVVPTDVPASSMSSLKTLFLAPSTDSPEDLNFKLKLSDGKNIVLNDIPVTILPYKPELAVSKITKIEASDYLSGDPPTNVMDNNNATKWSVNGDNKWLMFTLSAPFKISHLSITFLIGQQYKSYFDIYASRDNITWDRILTSAVSCSFSGDMQVFDIPPLFAANEYSYVKYVGHGNSVNNINTVSELKIFGVAREITTPNKSKQNSISIYPNPASDYINVSIAEPVLNPSSVRIFNTMGKIIFEHAYIQGINKILLPDSINSGIYIVELRSGNSTLQTQKIIIQK